MTEEAQKKTVHILLLEDSVLDAELAKAKLRKSDMAPEVTLARDRREYEEALLARPYDLILADYALPDFDGIAALALAHEKLPHIPFVFISGRVGEEIVVNIRQGSATDYVQKNRLERLVPVVVRALKEAQEHLARMEAEVMLRQSELRFRHVIDGVSQMIWVATPDGALLYSNRVWRDNYQDNMNHWCDPHIFHPQDYAACAAAWKLALEKTKPFSMEARLLRLGDQTYRWHLLHLTPFAADPESTGAREINWLGTATDLQDQKLNEEALRTAEKLSVTGRMAAAIAHEINNPLESLTNLLYLVRLESEGNTRALSYLDMTDNELERIAAITKQTLQFYRDPAVPVDVDTQQILEEVVGLFATRMKAKGINVTLKVRQVNTFQGIQGEIRQVLINLVNNAIDAVQQHGRIDIEADAMERDGRPAVRVLVHDNGTGITPEQSERLFQPFFSTKGAHGTGLGLWVSRGIVEKHGGTLELASRGSNGSVKTTATVVLPLKASEELQQDGA